MLRAYDAMFILDGSSDEEAIEKQLKSIAADVERVEGRFEQHRVVGRRNFARVLNRRSDGVYINARLMVDPAQVDELRRRLGLNADVFRMQILRADEKNPVAVNPPEAPVAAATEERD